MEPGEINSAIEARLGVRPGFFTLAKDSPPIVERLFAQAKFAYLDAPFPPLFKEILFTYLSRFCPVPYCMLRHAAFLVGHGHPAGDQTSVTLAPADVVQLLRTPVPSAEEFKNYISVLQHCVDPLRQWPATNSTLERAFFFAGVSMFLEWGPFTTLQTELRRILGPETAERFSAFLSFVRTAHYWTMLHPESGPEADVEQLIAENPELASQLEIYAGAAEKELGSTATETIAQLQLAVQRTEARQANLNDILEHSLNEIYLFDENTLRFVHVNQGGRDNLGYSLDELRELTPLDIKPEMTRDTLGALLEPLRNATTAKVVFTTLHKRKDGSTYPVEVHLQRSQFDSTPVFLALSLDVSERVQTEDALAQARLFLESAPDATIIVNSKGAIEIANSQTSKLFGYTYDELYGMQVETLVPQRFRRRHIAHRKRFTSDPKVRAMGAAMNLFAVTKSGQEIPIEVSLSPIQTPAGSLAAASIRDITARKAIEQALEQAKLAAENATVTKSRFLAAASHDLRQPLQSLRLYLSALTRQLEQPKLLEIGTKMRKSLDSMGELLDALLDISKFDGGSITLKKRDVQIQILLNRIVTGNTQQAEEKGLQLICDSNPWVIYSDPGLLERVLENFVTNAIRYTKQGKVTIDCLRRNDKLRIEVRDTGVGIVNNALETIFEEYYQLDNSMREQRQGLGLGLAIVKHIAALLDHPLDVTSVPGEGSVFAIEVPLGKQEVEQVEPRAPVRARARGDNKPVVLIVEDDPAVIDATTMLLELMSIQVHSAFNCDAAMASIEAGVCPDILIADYRLPGCSGIEVIRRVRQATSSDLPVIIMTGDTSTQEMQAANISNCTILRKPADTDRLIALIEKITAE